MSFHPVSAIPMRVWTQPKYVAIAAAYFLLIVVLWYRTAGFGRTDGGRTDTVEADRWRREVEVDGRRSEEEVDGRGTEVEVERPLPAKRSPFPRRKQMEQCKHPFGKVTVFVGIKNSTLSEHYRVAQNTLQCYLKSTDYELLLVDIFEDERAKKHCARYQDIMFRRHCVVAQYLPETDWMLVLDADTGVVNPEHCIEEFIDDRVHLVFYERFFNLEIMAGNYLVKNSAFGRKFVLDWAEWEFRRERIPYGDSDNCVLHMHVMENILNETAPHQVRMCDKIWKNVTGYDSYMGFVTCTKIVLGANRLFPGKLKVIPKGQGFARDAFLTADRFSADDFLFHGWKQMEIGENGWNSPFKTIPDPSACGSGLSGWEWRDDARKPREDILRSLREMEERDGRLAKPDRRLVPWNVVSELEDCFPHCIS